MKRLNENEIVLTQKELDDIINIIRDYLHSEWDHYTDRFISDRSLEEGMRYMNKYIYDFAEEIRKI